MTYEWNDNDGVKHVTAWSKAVRNAMLRGGAEFQRQKALNQAENNWKAFLGSTGIGLHRIGQAASTGAQSDLMDSTRWGWSCMLQLQEMDKTGENRRPQPGQLSSYLETVKAVFISMWEVAPHDWSSCESEV
jgi:hypothetical protein